MFIFYVLLFFIFLSVGSFLNVLAYRVTFDKQFFRPRSHCNNCDVLIAWYDNIPIFSWIVLGGKCRKCKAKISSLYPFIEMLTAIVLTVVFVKIFSINFAAKEFFEGIEIVRLGQRTIFDFSLHNVFRFIVNFIFFSSLIVATRTDLEAMVIPQCFSLWLVPFVIISSYFGLTNTSPFGSVLGVVIGYGVLWLVAKVFKKLTGREGLGGGDMDFLALIGSFLGPLGVWMTLMIGSISGLLCGVLYLLLSRKNLRAKIPFGPFLALGAFLYFIFEKFFFKLFFL